MRRKTKIIATLGPATQSAEAVRNLILAGANIFRLNMSHAPHDWTRELVGTIRTVASELDANVATLIDLQGPSIRTGDVAEKLVLTQGDLLEFRNAGLEPALPLSVTTNYDKLHEDVAVDKVMLVDNGEIHVRILRIEEGRLTCEVLTDGTMGSRRHINLPGIRVNLPVLTDKDMRDLDLAAELAVDYVAISFVRDAEHVTYLREQLLARGCSASIVSKIEDQEAVKHLTGIIQESDAVMVARGDLGIEVHIEELPIVQRTIVRECARIGRKVIVATHMLESMIENPVPTRAEVTDVANAVYEQADAVMVSGETSVGHYPVKCIEILDRIARRMEREPGAGFAKAIELSSDKQHTVNSAVVLANSLEHACLVIFTARGILANYTAHQRPERADIFAFSPDEAVVRSLVMNRAVTPFQMEMADHPEDSIRRAVDYLKEKGLIEAGSPVVILSDILNRDFDTEAILLRKA
ncbi:MAG: pyruvate kinase [Verrucomicrobiales bacterium]|jgi:pyruvate kinase|nr:pyruvate kinase [Verrucomicrobiales bacterium]MDP4793108.1 pyruvate kinase [Verrucomicrobiales bacterium]MDP4940152.1 pyruvate kinase [Verrucomicrobiales bacterium]MDP5006156.1 pyruvate kinase [Verrucomicrobiales bacterium]